MHTQLLEFTVTFVYSASTALEDSNAYVVFSDGTQAWLILQNDSLLLVAPYFVFLNKI